MKLLVPLLLLLLIPFSLNGQGIITFSSGSFSGETVSLDFTAGETVSGNFSNSSITLVSGALGFQDLVPTSSEVISDDRPAVFRLHQNYPNPFNPSTVISFELPVHSDVRLDLYNMLGQQVAVLKNEQLSAGSHTVSFNASNLASGIYIYRLFANGALIGTKKMMLIK